jgi:hypothetical protein
MSNNDRGGWGFLKITLVTAVGMVSGASLLGLYRFVAAGGPKRGEEPASWSAPGMARSGPKVSVEQSSDLQAPALPTPSLPAPPAPVIPSIPVPSAPSIPSIPAPSLPAPAPAIPSVELPPVRTPEVIPVKADTPPTPSIPSLPAAPVEVKPPVPADLPAVKPTPLPTGPKVTPTTETKDTKAPPIPAVSGPTELGPFKLANTPEAAPQPRPKTASVTKPMSPVPMIPKSTEVPSGPSAPLPNRPAAKPNPAPNVPMIAPPSISPVELPKPTLPEKPLQPTAPANTLKSEVPGFSPTEPALPKPAPFPVEPMSTPTSPAVSYPAPMIPAPGVELMPLPTRQLFLSTTLGVALALTPATTPIVAQQIPMSDAGKEKEKEPAKQPEQKLVLDEATKKLLESIKNDLNDIKKVQKDHADLIQGKELATNLADKGLLVRISELEGKVTKLETTIKLLEEQLKNGGNKSTSAKPTEPSTPATNPTKAYIRIVNDYPVEMSILINATKSHRVASGSTQLVEVPPGSYSYELLHTGAQPKSGLIKEGETITLRIN